MRTLVTKLVFSVISLAMSGCVPENVSWLPDSGGIVFSNRDGSKVYRYDLEKKSRKVIVDNTGAKCTSPAISPDGKTIAILKCSSSLEKGAEKAKDVYQIVFYDVDGNLRSVSKEHVVFKNAEFLQQLGSTVKPSYLIWSSNPDKIICSECIYDLKKDKWTSTGAEPFFVNPTCPNNKGFIATLLGDSGKIVFVDWDGWTREIESIPKIEGDCILSSQIVWDKTTAKAVSRKGVYELDMATMKCKFTKRENEVMGDINLLTAQYAFPESENIICMFTKVPEIKQEKAKDGPFVVWPQGPRTKHWIEVQNLKEAKKRIIMRDGTFTECNGFFSSPDGKKIALTYELDNKEKQDGKDFRIAIIDSSGEIMADFSRD